MENLAHIALSGSAPADERMAAHAEMQKSSLANASPADMLPLIQFMQERYAETEFNKALGGSQRIINPSLAAQKKLPGMQSVFLDDMQISVMGDYYEKQSAFSMDSMRSMVEGTPILNAVIMTRIRQVQRFCRVQTNGKGPGFKVALKDPDGNASDDDKKTMKLLESFFMNSGWENKPRQRMRLKRDDFSGFMAKLTRDSLTLDSAGIETEWKRDRKLGLDGMYAVDGATLRLCTEQGYEGDDEIFALQVVQGNIRSLYTYDDLIYVPRNPRTDVQIGGYGLSETELLVRVVTGFLNAFTYNTKYFDSNQIPKGLLHLNGDFSEQDIASFKRQWNAMVKGVNNQWALPVMVSKNSESRAAFENFGVEVNEMMFGKWMTFLSSLICAVYGIGPDEINFESFGASNSSSLSGNDTEEKLANSKDKGLRPLLAYFENLFSEFIVQEFGDRYVFRWTGLDEEDPNIAFERKKLIMTWDEMRAEDDMQAVPGGIGAVPLNPALIPVWQAANQQQQQPEGDFGQPGQEQPGAAKDGEEGAAPFGKPDAPNDAGGDFGKPPAGGATDPDEAAGGAEGDDADAMTKSFGLPIFAIEV